MTDYDGSQLSYAYDEVGNVTSMTDYHGNVTSYTYTDLHQLDTITAPGSRVWDFDYNAIGQPEQYSHPNGMLTDYIYDGDQLLQAIEHINGAQIAQSFDYTLDPVGNIKTITHEDGSWWEYFYDDRYRLDLAMRHNKPTPTISAVYDYDYDDADNMTTKDFPWEDDFSDRTLTDDGWVTAGTWTADNRYAQNTADPAQWQFIGVNSFDLDNELYFTYTILDSGATDPTVAIQPRYESSSGKRLAVYFDTGEARLRQHDGVAWQDLDSNASGASALGTRYTVRIVCDGKDIEVWRADGAGGLMTKILETDSAATDLGTNTQPRFLVGPETVTRYDNVRILAADLDRTATFAYNAANELTSMTDYNGTTTFTYDEWGRTTQKSRGPDSTGYTYRYGSMLHTATVAIFPALNVITYEYGGNLKRRERTTISGDYTWFNWAGFTVVNEEDENVSNPGAGNLTRSYFFDSFVDGTDPATGQYQYVTGDHLGSSRGVFDQNRTLMASLEFTPFGTDYALAGAEGIAQRFTGHYWDPAAGHYFAPFRSYSPDTARWMKRDPLGMVNGPNEFAYVGNDPINYFDPTGLQMELVINPFSDMSPEDQLRRNNYPFRLAGAFTAGWYQGGFQVYDTAIPFIDPFKNSGLYGDNSPGIEDAKLPANIGVCAAALAGGGGLLKAAGRGLFGQGKLLGPNTREQLANFPKALKRIRGWIRYDPPHHGKPAGLDGRLPNLIRRLRDLLNPFDD